MTYYYYDKVLVSNYRLRELVGYAGKMTGDSVVQLSAQMVEGDDAILREPEGISVTGDFYQVALSGKVIYRIHKGGNLIRAYAAEISQIETTVMGIPASIQGLLRGKILLAGSLLRVQGWAYVLTGEGVRKEEGSCGKSVMIWESEGQFVGVSNFRSPETEMGDNPLALLGIFVRHCDRSENAIEPMDEPERKRDFLLRNMVGYAAFPEELKQRAQTAEILDKLCREIYMVSMLAK